MSFKVLTSRDNLTISSIHFANCLRAPDTLRIFMISLGQVYPVDNQ